MLALFAWWLGSFSPSRDWAADFVEAERNARSILDNMTAHFRNPGGFELMSWFSSLENHPGSGFVGGHDGLLGNLGGDCEDL
jgi:hypothetical protein